MTSALRRLAYLVTDRIHAKQLLQRLATWKFVLLSVTVESTCFANVLSVARCVTRLYYVTRHAVFEKIAGQVARQITLRIRT